MALYAAVKTRLEGASDSFTACPETFKEFYNQRRRWMPSTMMNIVDLIADLRLQEKYAYILYQSLMMLGTVIGPGSIFLILI